MHYKIHIDSKKDQLWVQFLRKSYVFSFRTNGTKGLCNILNSIHTNICVHSEIQNMTLFLNSVSVVVTK